MAPLYLSFSFFWEYCPLTVVSIDFSNTSLQGEFPTHVFSCSQIQSLDFSLNNISGDLPLEKLSSLKNLKFLNLSYNRFSECRVSEMSFFERFKPSSFVHSGILPDHGKLRIKAVLTFVGFPVLVIGTVTCFGWLCFCGNEHEFSPSILEEASHGFSKRNLVGRTSRSSVYRGVLRDGSEVMIEVYLEKMSRENRRRCLEESKILVQLDHRNVVRVLGWCDSRRFMAVVTEWIDGKNIETWLKSTVPPWKQRVQVILAVAAGIRYLHEEWPEVRYNLKSRNVQLSENGEPIISRFKLHDHHHSSTNKIYEFGVLVLEIVTGGEDLAKNEGGFVEWVKLHYPGDLGSLIDRRMSEAAAIVSEAAAIVEFGLVCTDLSSRRQQSWDKFGDMLLKISHTHRGRGHGHKYGHHRQH